MIIFLFEIISEIELKVVCDVGVSVCVFKFFFVSNFCSKVDFVVISDWIFVEIWNYVGFDCCVGFIFDYWGLDRWGMVLFDDEFEIGILFDVSKECLDVVMV